MTDLPEHWHLDKKVPLALIVTIVVQTCAIVWWASQASARLDQLERRVEASAPQAERIIRVETKIEAMFESLSEIKNLIRRTASP